MKIVGINFIDIIDYIIDRIGSIHVAMIEKNDAYTSICQSKIKTLVGLVV
jgi:hypothetical protein